MDPIGNVPFFVSAFKDVEESRRIWVVARECIIALLVLLVFLFFGPTLMLLLGIGQASLHISGGVVLFIISVGIIFLVRATWAASPTRNSKTSRSSCRWPSRSSPVPRRWPRFMILSSRQPDQPWLLVGALGGGVDLTAGILMLSAP